MIYVTGDLHGGRGYRFNNVDIRDDDYVIICGDFGKVWDDTSVEKKELDLFSKKKGTYLFVDGNHENFPLIYSYPEEEWNGGKIHRIRHNILHLERGYVFTIEGKKIFVMGGGTSIDKMYRIDGISWWKEEMPTREEFDRGFSNLDKVNWKVDYVCTHAAPNNAHDLVIKRMNSTYKTHDDLTCYLESIDSKLEYKQWFFGHYHQDWVIDDKHTLLYYNVREINERDKK